MATGAIGAVLATELSFRLLTVGVYLAGALLLAAIVIAVVSRWRRRSGDECLTPADQLSHFRSLYERGTLSAEEFQRLRTLLTGQVSGPPAGKPSGDAVKPSPTGEPPQPPPNGVYPA